MVLSTRSRIAIPVVGVLFSIGGLAGSAAAAPPSATACPSDAAGTFAEHFNSKHLEKTALGAGDIVADPSTWVGAHGALFTKMISQATTGTCGGSGGGGGYEP